MLKLRVKTLPFQPTLEQFQIVCGYEISREFLFFSNIMTLIVDKFAPIFGLQWHPEKSLFMHNPVMAVDHSIFAVAVAQYISNVFMGFARQNPNQFKTRKEEEKHLIYNYTPLYVGNVTETPYEQIYTFSLFSPSYVSRNIRSKDLH